MSPTPQTSYQVSNNSTTQRTKKTIEKSLLTYFALSKFVLHGGVGVACWPLLPKFAGSNPAEAVGFLGRKNPQHTFLRRRSKAVGPMS